MFSDKLLSRFDPNFKHLFFSDSRSSLPLALVLGVEGPWGLFEMKVIFDIRKENDSSKTFRNNDNKRMHRCDSEPPCNTAGQQSRPANKSSGVESG